MIVSEIEFLCNQAEIVHGHDAAPLIIIIVLASNFHVTCLWIL